MTTLQNRLRSLQEQMQRRWDLFEVATGNGDPFTAGIHEKKYHDLEAHEAELLAQIRALKVKEKVSI